MNKIFIITIIMSLSISAQVFNLAKGWNLVGAVEDIRDLSVFTDERCNMEIFVYRDDKFLDFWNLLSIKKTEGFWTYSINACVVDTAQGNKKITDKKAKVFLIKPKDIKFIKNDGATPPSDNEVLTKTIEYVYSEKDYKEYLDEMSFGNLKLSFEKGSVLEIDSYPIETNNPANEGVSYKVVDVNELANMIRKIIPKEDMLKYDPIILHLITSQEVQYTSSGVALPQEMEIDGKTIETNFFMYQVQNENITETLREMEKETIIDSSKATILHEIFHTFGFLRHANTLRNNKREEYGNVFDVMGYASLSVNLNPAVRDTFNWLDDSNTIFLGITKTKSENITLHALNGKTGKRVVRIQIDIDTSYYLSFMGEDKWFITSIKPNEDYSTYTGFDQKVSKELINENKKGLFIVKDNGIENEFIRNNQKDVTPVFKQNDTYDNKFFAIDGIKVNGDNSINFNLKIK